MNDYISRADAIQALVGITAYNSVEEIQAACFDSYARANGWLGGVMESIAALAEGIPAADVRPVVYGHMIGKEEAEKIFEEDYSDYPIGQCSVCGHCDWDCVDSEGFNYCPNCGAKMGGTDGRQE